MNYSEWLEEHYPHLYEIYYHIILPHRKRIKEQKTVSTVSFKEFCQLSYERHGSRLV
jgi:hypothetical protein